MMQAEPGLRPPIFTPSWTSVAGDVLRPERDSAAAPYRSMREHTKTESTAKDSEHRGDGNHEGARS
jgi:hypothetical protein